MPERRDSYRPGGADRRSFPRPPLWLNLLLLIIAAATFGFARYQRDVILKKTSILFRKSENNPAEPNSNTMTASMIFRIGPPFGFTYWIHGLVIV